MIWSRTSTSTVAIVRSPRSCARQRAPTSRCLPLGTAQVDCAFVDAGSGRQMAIFDTILAFVAGSTPNEAVSREGLQARRRLLEHVEPSAAGRDPVPMAPSSRAGVDVDAQLPGLAVRRRPRRRVRRWRPRSAGPQSAAHVGIARSGPGWRAARGAGAVVRFGVGPAFDGRFRRVSQAGRLVGAREARRAVLPTAVDRAFARSTRASSSSLPSSGCWD